MDELPHPPADEIALPAVLFALSDPVRLAIVRRLADDAAGPASCQAVGGEMPKSTRSHHLKVLREAGVTRTRPQGRERLLTLRRDDLDARWPGLLAAVLAESQVS
jgi:DNA-binding transcriptional ArsR family regulator